VVTKAAGHKALMLEVGEKKELVNRLKSSQGEADTGEKRWEGGGEQDQS